MASELLGIFVENIEMRAKAAFRSIIQQSRLIEGAGAVGHPDGAEKPNRVIERFFRGHAFLLLATTTAGMNEAGRVGNCASSGGLAA